MLLWFDVAWKTGKSYWQTEYLQHLPAPPWRTGDGEMVGVLPQNSGHLQSPIMRRWFNHAGYILSESMVYGHKMLRCFIQTIGWCPSGNEEAVLKPRHEMETNWKTLEYSDILIIIFVPHFPICLCWCDQTSI